jgi:hypothetical protein
VLEHDTEAECIGELRQLGVAEHGERAHARKLAEDERGHRVR